MPIAEQQPDRRLQKGETILLLSLRGDCAFIKVGVYHSQREQRSSSAGTMKSFGDFRVGVLALVILSLCTYGDALECYGCPVFSKSCNTITCDAKQNACLKLTTAEGIKRQCIDISRCQTNSIKDDFGVSTNFKYECCQRELCNSSVTSLPTVGLLLSLATALLFIFCR